MTPQMLSNTLERTRYQRSTTKQEVSTGDNAEAPACGLTHQASGVYIPYNDAVERPEPLLSRHFCALFLHLCHKLGSLCKRGAWTADGHRVHPRAHHHRLAGVIEVVVGARHELNGVQVAHTHACFSGGCQLDLRRGNRVAIVGHGGRARCTPAARMCTSKYWHTPLLAHSQHDFQQPHGAKSGAALSGCFAGLWSSGARFAGQNARCFALHFPNLDLNETHTPQHPAAQGSQTTTSACRALELP